MAEAEAPGGDGKLPLADDFFSVPQLNAKEAKYLLGLAKHACKEVVYYSRRSGGPMQWVHLASDDGVEVFQGVDASSTAGSTPVASSGGALTYLRGSCRIHASLDEIADFFKLDTPEKLQGFSQTVGKDLLDHKTLLTLATPTPENPKHYVAVKWTAVESPTKLARNRDFCYLESHDEFIDTASRKRGWVRSIHSIRLPFCPPLRKSHGLIRGSFYRSGFIFIESNSGSTPYVDAVHTLHLDIKGRAPMWAKLLVMKRRIKNIAQVNAYFQMRRLAHGPRLLGELELPAKNGVARCQLCETKFGIFHRKWRCRKCGRVICTSCGHHFLIDGSAIAGGGFITASGSGSGNGIVASASGNGAGAGSSTNNLKKVRICVQCSESVVFGGMVNGTGTTAEDSTETKDVGDFTESRGVKRIPESIRPVYDESPGSSATTDTPLDGGVHPNNSASLGSNPHQFSVEENEYYAANEDAAGLADMLDAKRMANEFEEQLKSGRGTRGSLRSIRDSMGPSSAHAALAQSEKRGHRSANDDVGTTPASDASTAMSGLHNPYNQSFELGRKDSLDSIRMSGDWGSYGVESSSIHRHPPTHLGAPTDESGGRRTPHERPSALTNSLLSSVDSPSASNSMAMAAAAANRRPDTSGSRPNGAPGSRSQYVHQQRHERQASFLSEEGWGYRANRTDSGEEQYYHDAPARDRLISSHDPASLRRFIDQTQRSSGGKSEDAEREHAEREHDSRSTRSLDNEHDEHRGEDGAKQRRTHEYFNSRNARLAQLENHVGDSYRHYSETPSRTRSRRNGGSGDSFESAGSREYDRRRRQYRGTRPSRYDRYDRYEEDSDGGYRGHSRGRGDSDETLSTATAGADDELAQYMAMEAMRLYEQEMGPRLRVTEDTKRAALRKMMAVYAQEIERSQQRERHAHRRYDRHDRHDHSRERYNDDRNRERYYDQRDRYRSDNIPRERGRRRGSSVDEIGDDSRSFYMQLQHNMGGSDGAAQVPEQHVLRRSVSDQRYMTSHLPPPPSYDEHFRQNEPRYRGVSPARRENVNGGPPPTSTAMERGRPSIDSSSSDEDDEEVELRRRRRAAKSADAAASGAHEYRDLADISSRTFQELQIKSFGPGNGLTDRHHGDGERVEEKQGERVSAEPNHSRQHHSHPAPAEPTPENLRADRRNNDTIISTVEAHERLHNVAEDDNASISNSYHHNDSFIGQPSPRFVQRDSVSTVLTANGGGLRTNRQRTGTTSSSGDNLFASSRATDATSTRAMRDTTGNGEENGGLNADSRSASSSSLAGMVMGPDRSTFGSVANSDLPRGSFASGAYARPNSMHEVAESDTFSEMDLSELPHLMRKDDEADAILRRSMALMDRRSVGSRSSFTDLQHWEPPSNGAPTASASNDASSRVLGNGTGVETINEHGLRLSDVPADREEAIAMGMRSLGGPQHVRQFSDDSSTDSFMRGWGSGAGVPVPETPSPVSSGSSRHRRRSNHQSFGLVPNSVNSEPRLSGNDMRMSTERFRGHNGTALSDTSSSFYSDDGDYRASAGAYPRGAHHGAHHHLVVDPRSPSMSSDRQSQQLSVSELRRFRKSITELLSEYSDDASHQPELEPDHGSGGEPVVPTVVLNSGNVQQPAAFPSEGAAGMSRGSEKIRELFL